MTSPIGLLVAGDDARRQDHGVAGADLHLLVVVHRDAGERRHRLALAAGREQRHLLAAAAGAPPRGRPAGPAARAGSRAPARSRRSAPCRARRPRPAGRVRAEMSSTCWMRCRCDANVATSTRPRARRNAASSLPVRLRSDGVTPGTVDVGRVGEQRQHAGVAERGEARQVGRQAVERRLVELEVAGVDDRAERRPDRERHRVDDAVRDVDRLDLERPDAPDVARLEALERRRRARAPRASARRARARTGVA